MKNIIFFTLFILFFACKKDECKNDNETLVCTPCEEVSSISDFEEVKKQERSPCFNPNNMNEFVYVNKLDDRNFQLVKYDIVSKQSLTLYKGTVLTKPSWGKNNIIVFTDSLFQLRIVKPDASLNKRLTNGNAFLYPIWKNDSTIIAEYSKDLNKPNLYCEYYLNKNKYYLDTLNGYDSGYRNSDYNRKGQYIFMKYSSDSIFYLRETTSIRKILIKNSKIFGTVYSVVGVCWHPTEEVIYYTVYNDGLYKLDVNTLKATRIRNGCSTRTYGNLSISADGKKIIVERIDAKPNNGGLLKDAGIYIMDIDGKNERKIEL